MDQHTTSQNSSARTEYISWPRLRFHFCSFSKNSRVWKHLIEYKTLFFFLFLASFVSDPECFYSCCFWLELLYCIFQVPLPKPTLEIETGNPATMTFQSKELSFDDMIHWITRLRIVLFLLLLLWFRVSTTSSFCSPSSRPSSTNVKVFLLLHNFLILLSQSLAQATQF